MSNIVDEIFVAKGGLNYDDDPRFFESGDTDYRLNVIPTHLGDNYVLTNIKGTTTKTHAFTHAGAYAAATYTSLGSCYDIKRNAVYFFIYSSLSNHCILRYNIDDDDFDKIVWDNTQIGLDSDYPITDAYVLDNWLFWNPRSSSPRSINVEWAYWDYAALTAATATGDYVKDDYNQVWLCIDYDMYEADTPYNYPDRFTFVDWCYNDVYSGVLDRERTFYHTTEPLNSRIACVYATDEDYLHNNIRGNTFQFTYRYYVPDFGYGVTAPFTATIGEYESESYDGAVSGNVTRRNLIKLRLYFDYLDGSNITTSHLFDHVEILFRNTATDYWRSMVKINHEDLRTTNYHEYSFYNNSQYNIVDNAAIEVPYNYLPVTARAQCALDGERAAYGGCVESYDKPTLSVTLTPSVFNVNYQTDFEIIPASPADTITFTETGPSNGWYTYTSDAMVADAGYADDILVLEVDGTRYKHVLIAGDLGSNAAYAAALEDLCDEANPGDFVVSVNSNRVIVQCQAPRIDIEAYRYDDGELETVYSTYKVNQPKTGAWHDFCLFYWDAVGRRSEPFPIDPVYIPFLPESDMWAYTGGMGYSRRITYAISHNAPSWASLWGFGYAGNRSISKFWQYTIVSASIVDDATSEYDNLSYVDISSLQGIKDDGSLSYNFPNSKIEPYQFEEGDRIRFMTMRQTSTTTQADMDIDQWYTEVASGTTDANQTNKLIDSGSGDFINDGVTVGMVAYNETDDTYATITAVDSATVLTLDSDIFSAAPYEDYSIRDLNQHDYEIVAFDPTNNYIYFDSGEVIGDTAAGAEKNYNDTSVVVEIYRPKKKTDDPLVYYEINLRYPVDQSSYVYTHNHATGTLRVGDVMLMTRVTSNNPLSTTNPIFVESFEYSDFYESSAWIPGKAGVVAGIGERSLNIVRYSNKYNKNTLSGGLGRFDGLDYKTLSYRYGNITAIRQIGETLKIIFENNVASVLVNKSVFYNADGTSQVVLSDQILSSVRYSEEIFGSVNPESVCVWNRDLYFFDLRRKAYIRNSPNGSFPISDYKMRRYFVDKADALLASGEANIKVYSAWDDDHDLLWVGFDDNITTENCEYVLFHEPSNRWVTFVSVPRTPQVMTMADDPNLSPGGQNVDFSLVTTDGVSVITAINDISFPQDGAYNATASFNDSSTLTLNAGDSYSISIENTQGSTTAFDDILKVTITGTGDIDSAVLDTGDFAYGTPYEAGDSVSQTSTIKIAFTLTGQSTFEATDFYAITWSITANTYAVPSMLGTPGGLFSFVAQNLYIHNDNATRCKMFGNQEEYTVRVYAGSSAPNIIKTFDSIALHTNKYFDGEDVQIPATLNYPNGMESRLPESRFEKEEGVLRTDYLCNMKTTSSSISLVDLFAGDSLRGYYIYQDLVGDETVEHNLYKVDVFMTQSKY